MSQNTILILGGGGLLACCMCALLGVMLYTSAPPCTHAKPFLDLPTTPMAVPARIQGAAALQRIVDDMFQYNSPDCWAFNFAVRVVFPELLIKVAQEKAALPANPSQAQRDRVEQVKNEGGLRFARHINSCPDDAAVYRGGSYYSTARQFAQPERLAVLMSSITLDAMAA